MLAYIKGQITQKETDYIVVENNGLGFQIHCDMLMLGRFPAIGSEAKVYTYQNVTDTSIMLYGFPSLEEKLLFEQVITVSGIGPKSGATIIAAMPPEKLAMAIITDDIKTLSTIKGIGKKSAQRLCLELKDRFKKLYAAEGTEAEFQTLPESVDGGDTKNEAVQALMVLGYSQNEAERAIVKIMKEDPAINLEDLIKRALQSTAKI